MLRKGLRIITLTNIVSTKTPNKVRYVQGMNEIVGTLYFVLAHDSNEDWAKEAEADTYFLFNSIMVRSTFTFICFDLICSGGVKPTFIYSLKPILCCGVFTTV